MATAIESALTEADEPRGRIYAANAAVLRERLRALDAAYRIGLENCRHRTFVSSHAAFRYLAHEYGLTQIAISGLSPEAEPSPRTLAGVADTVKLEGIRYIFFETLIGPELSETIARETGADILPLNPIEGLDDDEISAGMNYFTVMEENLANLKIALECQ